MPSDSFAAAQERILARQRLRQAESDNARIARTTALNNTPIAKLPSPLNRAAGPISSLWSTLLQSEGTNPAFRVGQVDAELLDEELLSLLKAQVGEAFKYFGTHIQDDWSKEITFGLRAILFKLSIWDNNASYGAALQNLRFADARKPAETKPTTVQKGLYGLITVLGRYGWEKWEDWLVEKEGGFDAPSTTVQMLSQLTNRVTTIHSIAAFTSFIVFLINGQYRTLTDRILRLRLISPIAHINRQVSFEYLNRQLVWHAFTEFLLFLLPLVGISRWRRWLSRAWKNTKAALQAEAEDTKDLKQGPLAHLPERTCAICYQDQNPTSTSEAEILGANTGAGGGVIGSATTDVVNPYETLPCGCIYCFVCIATKLESEEGSGWSCLRCGDIVYKCKPWSGDIVTENKPKQTNKSVGFVEDENNQTVPSELGNSQWALESADRDESKG